MPQVGAPAPGPAPTAGGGVFDSLRIVSHQIVGADFMSARDAGRDEPYPYELQTQK